jgi:predicted Zn finger-like uncharacterized protein
MRSTAPPGRGRAAEVAVDAPKVAHPPTPGTLWSPHDARCRACGAPIMFRFTVRGRWQPVEPDGSEPHGARCLARRPPRTSCPHCGSEAYVVDRDVPAPHHARALCGACGRSWWLAAELAR